MLTTLIPSSDMGLGTCSCVTSRPPTRCPGHVRVLLSVLRVRIFVFLVVLAVLAVRVREDDPQ